MVSWQAVEEGERGDVDFDCVQAFQDRLAFVVAGFAGAEDLRVAGDLRRGAFARVGGEEFFVDFEEEFCWEVEEAEGSDGRWLVGTAREAWDFIHGVVVLRGCCVLPVLVKALG